MAHTFNPKDSHKLDTEERKLGMPPDTTLKELGLKDGDVFIDVGCGTGYFIEAALALVGKKGKVVGLDISAAMLEKLKERITGNHHGNLELLQSRDYSFPLEDSTGTFALLSFVFHEVDDPGKFLGESIRVLKKGATVAVIDWEKVHSDKGPPEHHRIAGRDAAKILIARGLQNVKLKAIGSEHYAITGQV